jgi:hypothetical protein
MQEQPVRTRATAPAPAVSFRNVNTAAARGRAVQPVETLESRRLMTAVVAGIPFGRRGSTNNIRVMRV